MNLSEVLESNINAALRSTYTTLPGYVTAVKELDGSTVVDVQIGINRVYESLRATKEDVIEDIPIVWPSASGCYITMPIEVGDTVLLHFSMRCAIEWKNSLGNETQTPFLQRWHSVNDAFATPSMLPYGSSPKVDSEGVKVASGTTEIRILKDGTIELGEGATERLIKGDTFLSQLIDHSHGYLDVSGNFQSTTTTLSPGRDVPPTFGTPSPPVPDIVTDWESNLSEVNKTK